MEIKITKTENGKLTVSFLYNQDAIAASKNIGGKWDSNNRCWIFRAGEEQIVSWIRQLANKTWMHNKLMGEFIYILKLEKILV